MGKPVHTADTMAKLRGVLSSGPHKGRAIDAALNIVRKKREAGGIANDPTMKNPVGWSSIYPPQYISNQDPNVSPVVSRGSMTDLAAIGTLGRKGYVTAAELPAAEAKARQVLDWGMTVAGATQPIAGIRAFHGSPHTFDRFDMSKLGTGEGAQAYGHGLYFAGNEGVARSYRDVLSPYKTVPTDPAILGKVPGSVHLAKHIDAVISQFPGASADDIAAQVRHSYPGVVPAGLDDVVKSVLQSAKPQGSMYEVNLRTSPERLLDWDKPLSAQPAGVRDGATRTIQEYIDLFRANADPSIRNATRDAAVGVSRPEMTGAGVHEQLTRILGGDRAAAANVLKSDAGIDGIQYLDQGSRAAGEGSRNYVMFDDKLIDILRRYGLLGMVGGGAGAVAGEAERASGGAVETAMRIVRKKRADGGAVGLHTGPIHSSVAGRTDHLPMHVHSGSYVIPADIVSAMGEGNTMAGFKQINAMFGDAGNGAARSDGGMAKPPVPIVAAGGEYVLSPEQVAKAGDGDVDMGHRVLDEWVKRMRAKTIKTLTKLPGPKKD